MSGKGRNGALSGVSLVIPVHNEERRLPRLFSSIDISSFGEAIFVLDGCTDNSEGILPKESKKIVLKKKSGKGAALKAGFFSAKKEIVCFVDADGTFSQKQVEDILAVCGKGIDIALAERAHFPKKRAFKRFLLRQISRFLFGLGFSDTQCGLVVARRKSVRETIERISGKGYEFPVEFLWRAKSAGLKISTLPIRVSEEDYNSSTFDEIFDPVRMFFSLLKVRIFG